MSRYKRQQNLPLMQDGGQAKLQNACVAVIGAGGLGSPVLTYLTCAGVGKIRVIDTDIVEETNLNRQFFYTPEHIGQQKAEVATKRLQEQNPEISVEAHATLLDKNSIATLLFGADVVVDCVDNMQTRRLVNAWCVENKIPLVEGGIDGLYGYVLPIGENSPCFDCISSHEADVKKENVGVLGATAGVIGTLQATVCLKILLGGDVSYGNMLQYDGETMTFETISFTHGEGCPHHFHTARSNENH